MMGTASQLTSTLTTPLVAGPNPTLQTSGILLYSAERFLEFVREAENAFPTHGKLLLLYGDDMYFNDLTEPYWLVRQTEEMMGIVNAGKNQSDVSVHWATPSDYFQAISSSASNLSIYRGDFQPYMSAAETPEYWTGLYTLLPAFKKSVFRSAEVMRIAEILSAAVLDREISISSLSLAVHEDVLSGLGNLDLAEIYKTAVDYGTQKALDLIQEAAEEMLKNRSETVFPVPYRPVLLYNGLNWGREDLFRFETDSLLVEVLDPLGNPVESQAILNPVTRKYTVFFQTYIPALSLSVFAVIEHKEKCRFCAKDSVPYYSMVLSTDDSGFSVKFGVDGKVRSLSHPSFGLATFYEDFYIFRNSGSEPFTFSPGSPQAFEKPFQQYKVFRHHFQMVQGELFSAAQSIWRHEQRNISQLFLLPKKLQNPRLHWEISGNPLEQEDLMVGFRSNLTETEVPLYTYDSVAWRQRKFEKTIKDAEIGRNFYPVSGAVSLGNGPIVIPEYPLGVGVHDGNFLFHLQRSAKHGDTGVSEHRFQIDQRSTGKEWLQAYHESKQFNVLVSITDISTLKLTLEDVMSVPATSEPWFRLTSSWLGFESADLYLSSLVKKAGNHVIRVLSFPSDSTEFDWRGVAKGVEMYGGGYLELTKHSPEAGKTSPKTCFHDCNQGIIVDFPPLNLSEKARVSFSTFAVSIRVTVYREYDWISLFQVPIETEESGPDTKPEQESEVVSTSKTDFPAKENEPRGSEPIVEIYEGEVSTQKSTIVIIDPNTEEKSESSPSLPTKTDFSTSQEPVFLPSEPTLPPSGAVPSDIEVLEYCVLLSLGVISAVAIMVYYRSRKIRRD